MFFKITEADNEILDPKNNSKGAINMVELSLDRVLVSRCLYFKPISVIVKRKGALSLNYLCYLILHKFGGFVVF